MRIALTLIGVVAGVFAQAAIAVPTACQSNEDQLFNCSAGKKVIAVCASHDWSPKSGSLQYRFGPPQRAELVLPQQPATLPAVSAASGSLMFSGGGGAYLRFAGAGVDYVVYTAIGRGWGEKSGVVVEKAGKKIRSVKCRGAVSSQLGTELFDKAGFKADDRDFELPL